MNNLQQPIYLTRRFWLILVFVELIISIGFFLNFLMSGTREGYWLFFDFVASFGGMPIMLLAGSPDIGLVFGIGYFLMLTSLIFYGLKKRSVKFLPLLIASIIYLVGMMMLLYI